MTEVMVTTEVTARAKLHSNCHHQQTNTQLMDALPITQQCQSTDA